MVHKHILILALGLGLSAGGVAGCAGSSNDSADGGGEGGMGGGAGGMGGGAGGGGGGFAGAGGGGGDDNSRPQLRRIGDREAPADQELSINLEASDPDGDPLFFNIRSSLPEGAKFIKELGQFTWTPPDAQIGEGVLITFEVSDGELKDQETIRISVIAPGAQMDRAPEIDELGDQVVTIGQPFELQLEATDVNGDELTWRIDGETPEGAALDAATGLFQWTAPEGLAGQTVPVTFVVSDGALEDSAAVNFVIRAGGGGGQNLPPRVTPIEDREVEAGQQVRIQVSAEDDNPASLNYTMRLGPDGAQFDEGSAVFTWTPGEADVDQAHRAVFQVSDGEFRVIESVTLQVVRAGGGGPQDCEPDPDDPGAPPEAVVTGAFIENRSICPGGDQDDFTFEMEAGATFRVRIDFDHDQGDLDLLVEGNNDFFLNSSGLGDSEVIEGVAPAQGTYIASVISSDQRTINPNYTFGFEDLGRVMCDDDPFEGGLANDDAMTASDLTAARGQMLEICPNNDDYYAIELAAGAQFTLSATFTHVDGDLDMVLTGPDDQTWRGVSSTDNEEIVMDPVPATGTYVLRVYGYNGASNQYTLDYQLQAPPPCDDDRVEPNDDLLDAEPFDPELYTRLTWCGDPDWYKTLVGRGSQLQVFISYDGMQSPRVRAYDPEGTLLDGQSFDVVMGDGCRENRAGCRRLQVETDFGGFVHYVVDRGGVGMEYDLNIRVINDEGPACGIDPCANPRQVCDLQRQRCVAAACEQDDDCPGAMDCYQNWCVLDCSIDGVCRQEGYTCKELEPGSRCGYVDTPGAVGAACQDFTFCSEKLDCLPPSADVPGGYCSRRCVGDFQCGAGASCGRFDDGDWCGKSCVNNNDCRDNYDCIARPAPQGGQTRICVPQPPIGP